MRAALSMREMANRRRKPKLIETRRASDASSAILSGSRAGARSAGRGATSNTSTATTMPMPATIQSAGRHGMKVSSSAVSAGRAILPTSPLKLYTPSAVRERTPSKALATSPAAMGCCTLAPTPPRSKATNKPVSPADTPASRKHEAASKVPATSTRIGLRRSARTEAGICRADMVAM